MSNKVLERKIQMKTTGLILRAYAKNKGFIGKELAEKLGISSTFLSYILNDNRSPNATMLDKLREVLEIRDKDMADIKFYEAYRSSHPLIQMKLIEQQEEIERLKNLLLEFKDLEKLKILLKDCGFEYKK